MRAQWQRISASRLSSTTGPVNPAARPALHVQNAAPDGYTLLVFSGRATRGAARDFAPRATNL